MSRQARALSFQKEDYVLLDLCHLMPLPPQALVDYQKKLSAVKSVVILADDLKNSLSKDDVILTKPTKTPSVIIFLLS